MISAVDPEALKRAEAALAALEHIYIEWAEADCARLDAAWTAWVSGTDHDDSGLRRLFSVAHDMKGQAATFGYPLIGELGNRLCRLIEAVEAGEGGLDERTRLAALVAATGRVIRERISGDGGAVGAALLAGIDDPGPDDR
ncbi:Hpt domain-containing protein [Magnetospirillum molischianum]|uniref:Hpt domain-containing protein n=1 Tax=Magnetospirillum molischianum DSM 120 TaxID=1150626 RepID=H8FPA8_MAGML|nr:Hpt domain-containing protein [Magnetospirillum molischianum]CCG40196.1 Hpt domain-containing protein [Magnetospirillum molischianum DSM 120]